MSAWELVIEYDGERRVVAVTASTLILGRDPSSDVMVLSPVMSGQHARLVLDGGGYRFYQLGRNATTIGGEAADGRTIGQADVLVVGAGDAHEVRLQLMPTIAPVAQLAASEAESAGNMQTSVTIGRDQSADIVLPNPLVSRRHAALDPGDGPRLLRDLDSSNGTFVNGERVTRKALSAGDVVRIGPYRLAYDGRTLRVQDSGVAVTLAARHLVQRVKDVTILNDVSFACFPGEITAIGGTSGAGKTTLMDALTGLRPAAAGSVLLNGSSLYPNFESLRALIGYVPQSNILHLDLPLENALRYAARLRLPPDTDDAEIEMRVQASMHPLDLAERASLSIRNLSGGQQKRASIAMELLTEPSLFFLDEPTSGLDPGLSVRLMRLLRNLADAGKTVLLVSHDPESFEFCDQLVFLAAGGRLAFAGPPRQALEHFGVATYAEMYDRVESESTPEQWEQRFREAPAGRLAAARLVRAGAGTSSRGTDVRTTETPSLPLKHQAVQLTRRYAEVLIRDTRNLLTLIGQAPMIGLLLALLAKPKALVAFITAHGLDDQAGKAGDATKVLLLLALTAVWLGTINASREVVKEIAIWRRERLAGVAVVPYLGSKVVLLSIMAAVQNFLFLFVVSLRVQLPSEGVVAGAALEFYVTLLLASIASVALGLALSAASMSEERAITLVPLALIPQIMFAGIIFKLNGLMTVVSWLFVTRWAVKALGASDHAPGYVASGSALLGMWLVLVLMTGAYLYAAAWLILRRDRTVSR